MLLNSTWQVGGRGPELRLGPVSGAERSKGDTGEADRKRDGGGADAVPLMGNERRLRGQREHTCIIL